MKFQSLLMNALRASILAVILTTNSVLASPLKINFATGWGLLPIPWPDYASFYPGSIVLTGGPLGHAGATLFFGEQKVRAGIGLEAGYESWLYYKALASEQSENLFPLQIVWQLETGWLSLQAGFGAGLFLRRAVTSEKAVLQEAQVVPSMSLSATIDIPISKNVLLPVGLRIAGMIAPGASGYYSPTLRLLAAPTVQIAFRI